MPRRTHTPSAEELYEEASKLPDDVSWYNVRDEANRLGYSTWEQGYSDWCKANKGYVPLRLLNLGEPNVWGYPPGPACVRENLSGVALPPDVKQWQIACLNDCMPYDVVVVMTATANAMLSTLKSAKT